MNRINKEQTANDTALKYKEIDLLYHKFKSSLITLAEYETGLRSILEPDTSTAQEDELIWNMAIGE